jgi:hypothetical protein
MNFTGLSLDQAPPFKAPLRFFLTAPLFGMLAAVVIFFTDTSVLQSRYAPETIAVVHLLTIGFFGMVMLGALQQMLPVLAGVSLPKAVGTATVSHAALSLGTLAIAAGLYYGSQILIGAAALALAIGFLLILGAIAMAMRKVSFFTPTVNAMVIALIIALITVLVGLHLLGSHATGRFSEWHVVLGDIHSVFGIFGFAGILIIGVAFQVLPMFYVTSAYNRFFTAYVPMLLLASLLGWVVLNFVVPDSVWTAKLALILLFSAFGITIFEKMKSRRRPVRDVTIIYWYLGASMLIAGSVIWLYNGHSGMDLSPLTGVWVGGFVMAVMTGMLYKIVPFLAWFHLNAAGYMTIPTMKELINEKMAHWQLLLFVAAILLLSFAFFDYLPVQYGATALFLSMLLLEINLLLVVRTYRTIKKEPPEFSFEMPQG